MRRIMLVLTAAALAGCGVDNMSAAATAAASKNRKSNKARKRWR